MPGWPATARPTRAPTCGGDLPDPLMRRYTFGKAFRLRKSSEFDAVFAGRRSAGDGVLVVYAARSPMPHPRLGLVVSRKVGGAVRRNRWKRLLREAFRLAQHELPPLDLVCIPRLRGEPTHEQVARSLRQLAARLEEKIARREGEPSSRRGDKQPASKAREEG